MSILDLVQQLIAIPSTSGRERPLVDHVAGLLASRGIPHIVDPYGTTANLYVPVGQGDDILMLYAHTDVVPAPEALFLPRVEDGKLYGRGTTDMKSALAALLHVLLEDHERLSERPFQVLFTFIAEEETNAGGIHRFLEWFQPRRSLSCVLMEPTDDFTAMNVGGKGYVFLDLEGAMTDVLASFRAILARKPALLAEYPDQADGFAGATLELTKLTVAEPFEGERIQGRASHASRPQFGENAIEKALAQHGDLTALRSSDTDGPNSLPSWAVLRRDKTGWGHLPVKAHIDLRTNRSADAGHALFEAVRALIHPAVRISIRDQGRAFRAEDTRLIELCKGAKGGEVQERISSGGSDAPYLLPLTGSIVAGFGPGQCRLAHAIDERVDLGVLEDAPRIVRGIIEGFSRR
jgi:acetylornithine deacetylase/succinyl-diaminopimelate desuccinylase-like protein